MSRSGHSSYAFGKGGRAANEKGTDVFITSDERKRVETSGDLIDWSHPFLVKPTLDYDGIHGADGARRFTEIVYQELAKDTKQPGRNSQNRNHDGEVSDTTLRALVKTAKYRWLIERYYEEISRNWDWDITKVAAGEDFIIMPPYASPPTASWSRTDAFPFCTRLST